MAPKEKDPLYGSGLAKREDSKKKYIILIFKSKTCKNCAHKRIPTF